MTWIHIFEGERRGEERRGDERRCDRSRAFTTTH
jgi:hypothetical protein